MGLRNNILDMGSSPAEFLSGKTLRFPGEFILPEDFSPDRQFFLEEFRENMRAVKPAPVTLKHKRKIFFYKNLDSCTHVFLRVRKTLKRSLEHPYTGPHKILARISDKVYEIDVDGEKRRVSVENVNPAYFASESEKCVGSVIVNPSSSLPSGQIPLLDSDCPLANKPTLRTYINKKKVSFVESTKS